MIKFKDILNEKQWSGNIDAKYTPPEGLFNKSAKEIAAQLKKDSKDLKQAMSRAMFYYNRAGKKEPDSKQKAVAKELENLYGKE